jgi:spore germination protein KA
MLSTSTITELILHPLTEISPMPDSSALFSHIRHHMLLSIDRLEVRSYGDLFRTLNSGFALLLAQGQAVALAFGVQGYEKRSVGKPSGEANVLGAHEGFVETVRTNMSLLRRRMKSPLLKLELSVIGSVSRTDICLCYMTDRVPPELLRQIKKSLASADLETVLSTGYLQPFVENRRGGLFDCVSLTQRPDVLCSKLLEGRVGLLVDGTPFALVIPKLFVESFQTMDDYNVKPYYATFIRWLKYAAFLLAVLLPALYVAISIHHPELLNSTLLLILTEAESQAPLSLTAEAAGVLLMYEIIREAGLRLPEAVGGAVSIVGGLIIGDAAVSSGLISTPMLTVAAISVIAGFVVPDLNQSITVLRLCFLAAGGLWGLFGIGLLGMAVMFSLCHAECFGFPLTAPLSPLYVNAMRDVATRVNFRKMQSGSFTVEEYYEEDV